MKRIASID